MGTNVIIAQQWGARRYEEAGEAARHFLGLSVLVSLGLAVLGLSANRLIMKLLGAQPEVIALALPYSTLIFLVIPFTVLLAVLSSILQGTGDTKDDAMIMVNVLHIAIALSADTAMGFSPRVRGPRRRRSRIGRFVYLFHVPNDPQTV